MPDFAVRAVFGAVNKMTTILGNMGVQVGNFGNKAAGAMEKANASLSIFKNMLGANLVAGAIQRIAREVIQLPHLLGDFADRAEQIGRTASIIGMSADAWQRMSYAAKISDTSVEGLQGAMQKLNKNMADLTVGKGTLMDLLKFGPPGLAQQVRATHSASEAFLMLADAIAKTKDPQVRARMAVAAFGKAGQDMLPMLMKGRVELEKIMKITPDVIPDSAISAGERFAENFKVLNPNVGYVKNTVMGFVLQAVTPYLDKAVAWLQANKDIVATRIEDAITRLSGALRDAKPFLLFLWDAAKFLVKNWPLLLPVYVGWTAAQIALNVALDANPIGAVIIAVEAMVAAVIIVIHYWQQITSALQSAWNWFNQLFGNPWIRVALYMIAAPFAIIVSAIQTIVDLLSGKGWKSLLNMGGPLKAISDAIGITKGGGQWNTPEAAPPNAAAMQGQGMRWNGHIWVHAESGTSARVGDTSRGAPPITGATQGQYGMGGR